MPLPLLFLLCCTLAQAARPLPEIEREFREKKGMIFRALLDTEKSPEILAWKVDLRRLQQEKFAALARGERPPKGAPYRPANGSKLAELDMIWNAQDLKPAEKEEIQRLFREAYNAEEKFRAEFAHIQRNSQKVAELGQRQLTAMIFSLEKTAAVLRESKLDRDYAYRALLREHRRKVPGF